MNSYILALCYMNIILCQSIELNERKPKGAYPKYRTTDGKIYFWSGDAEVDFTEPKSQYQSLTVYGDSSPSESYQQPTGYAESKSSKQNSDQDKVDTYNFVITKNLTAKNASPRIQLLPDAEVEAVYLDQSSSPEENIGKLRRAIHNAVQLSLQNNEHMQEAIAQIVEHPGKPAQVNVLNSTISNVEQLEDTLNNLIGSSIIYQENRATNTALGVVPNPSYSAINSLLNQTVAKHSDSNGTKTNIVNLFIVNIIGTSNPSEETSVVDPPPLNEDGLPESLQKFDEILPLQNVLQFLPSNLNSSNMENKAVNSQSDIKNSNKISLNPHGLNLNKNTVLDLLPDFVRATTIAPIIPLYNSTAQEEIGAKPSVLGLLPNQLFDLSSPKFDRAANTTYGGIFRKESLTKMIESVLETQRLSQYKKRHLDTTGNDQQDVSLRSLLPDISKHYKHQRQSIKSSRFTEKPNVLGQPKTEDTPVVTEKPVEVTEKPEQTTPEELFHLINSYMKEKETLYNPKIKLSNKNSFEGSEQQPNNKLMRAVALGALPSSIALATASFPYWGPMVFGRKRRRRQAITLEDLHPYIFMKKQSLRDNNIIPGKYSSESKLQVDGNSRLNNIMTEEGIFSKDNQSLQKQILNEKQSSSHIYDANDPFIQEKLEKLKPNNKPSSSAPTEGSNIKTDYSNMVYSGVDYFEDLSNDNYTDELPRPLQVPSPTHGTQSGIIPLHLLSEDLLDTKKNEVEELVIENNTNTKVQFLGSPIDTYVFPSINNISLNENDQTVVAFQNVSFPPGNFPIIKESVHHANGTSGSPNIDETTVEILTISVPQSTAQTDSHSKVPSSTFLTNVSNDISEDLSTQISTNHSQGSSDNSSNQIEQPDIPDSTFDMFSSVPSSNDTNSYSDDSIPTVSSNILWDKLWNGTTGSNEPNITSLFVISGSFLAKTNSSDILNESTIESSENIKDDILNNISDNVSVSSSDSNTASFDSSSSFSSNVPDGVPHNTSIDDTSGLPIIRPTDSSNINTISDLETNSNNSSLKIPSKIAMETNETMSSVSNDSIDTYVNNTHTKPSNFPVSVFPGSISQDLLVSNNSQREPIENFSPNITVDNESEKTPSNVVSSSTLNFTDELLGHSDSLKETTNILPDQLPVSLPVSTSSSDSIISHTGDSSNIHLNGTSTDLLETFFNDDKIDVHNLTINALNISTSGALINSSNTVTNNVMNHVVSESFVDNIPNDSSNPIFSNFHNISNDSTIIHANSTSSFKPYSDSLVNSSADASNLISTTSVIPNNSFIQSSNISTATSSHLNKSTSLFDPSDSLEIHVSDDSNDPSYDISQELDSSVSDFHKTPPNVRGTSNSTTEDFIFDDINTPTETSIDQATNAIEGQSSSVSSDIVESDSDENMAVINLITDMVDDLSDNIPSNSDIDLPSSSPSDPSTDIPVDLLTDIPIDPPIMPASGADINETLVDISNVVHMIDSPVGPPVPAISSSFPAPNEIPSSSADINQNSIGVTNITDLTPAPPSLPTPPISPFPFTPPEVPSSSGSINETSVEVPNVTGIIPGPPAPPISPSSPTPPIPPEIQSSSGDTNGTSIDVPNVTGIIPGPPAPPISPSPPTPPEIPSSSGDTNETSIDVPNVNGIIPGPPAPPAPPDILFTCRNETEEQSGLSPDVNSTEISNSSLPLCSEIPLQTAVLSDSVVFTPVRTSVIPFIRHTSSSSSSSQSSSSESSQVFRPETTATFDPGFGLPSIDFEFNSLPETVAFMVIFALFFTAPFWLGGVLLRKKRSLDYLNEESINNILNAISRFERNFIS